MQHRSIQPIHATSQVRPECIYDPIRSPQGIRILRLEPGLEGDPIRCSLVHVDLDTSPAFEAISYAWGDAKDKRRIICNDRRFEITHSLFEALSMFRCSDRARDLWADAICINQYNIKERNSQVQLMARIYSGAEKVLVWLGHDQSDTILTAFEHICRLINYNDGRVIRRVIRDEMLNKAATYSWEGRVVCPGQNEIYPEVVDEDISTAMSRLYLCAFFRRGWVIQEVALSSIAVVHWGHAQINFAWLGLAAYITTYRHLEWYALSDEAHDNVATICDMYHIYFDQPNPSVCLVEYLEITRRALFSDARDKVFGLLGLRTLDSNPLESDTFIKVDYGIHKQHCYQAVAEKYLIQQRNLEILSSVHHDGAMHEQWPSWVPDWTLVGAHPLKTFEWKSSGGEEEATVSKEARSGRDCISIRGIVVDVIGQLFRRVVSAEPTKNEEARSLRALFLRLQDRFDTARIAWTAVAGVSRDGHSNIINPSSEDTRVLLDVYNRFLHWDSTGSTQLLGETALFKVISRKRDFFVTDGGLLGIGPSIVEPGDVIVVLFGPLLAILRPVGDMWRFVGECYVHDIMQGQAVEKWKESGEPAMDFCIY